MPRVRSWVSRVAVCSVGVIFLEFVAEFGAPNSYTRVVTWTAPNSSTTTKLLP